MSFSDNKKKCFKLGNAAGFSRLEKAFLTTSEKPVINNDYAVEIFVDSIRTIFCNFRFKKPLKNMFEVARDHALNCIEMGHYPSHTKYLHWINDCLKCTDCILFIYMRDVANHKITGGLKGPKERDLYSAYQNRQESDLKRVGINHHRAYTFRNGFTHHKIVTINGKQEIRPMSKNNKIIKYNKFRELIKGSLDIMVSRFRKAFPTYCTDKPHCKEKIAEKSQNGTR